MAKEPFVEVIGLEELKRKLNFAEQEGFPRAAATAINRSAKTTLSKSAKTVAKKMGLRQKDVRDNTEIQRARPDPRLLFATLKFRGDALNLVRFKARQIKKGVSAAPWGNRRIFRGAFMATIHGSEVVLIRKKGVGNVGEGETEASRRAAAVAAAIGNSSRKDRLPVRAMKGPGIAKSANEPELRRERKEVFRERMPIEFKRALEVVVRRLSR